MTKPNFPHMDYQPVEMPELVQPPKRNRKKIIAGVVAAAVLIPGAAWAAVQLLGFGQIDVAATSTQNLTIDNTQLVGTLYPGGTVGAQGLVHNPNNFPVKVTGVVVRLDNVVVTPNEGDCMITPIGSATTYPGGGSHPGIAQNVQGVSVSIPANGAAWVTVPQSMKQSADSGLMCGVKADFAVTAQSN